VMNEAGFSVHAVNYKANWSPPMGTQLSLGIRPAK
jgi:hypothetical protein